MERDMNAVARSLDRNPTFGLRKKAGVSKANKTIREYESLDGSTERIKFILLEFATKTFLGKVDLHKESPLHLAAKYGHTKLVALLIDAAKYLHNDDPVNPNSCFEAFIRQGNDRMNTALHLAVSNNNVGIAKLLVEADPSDRHIQNTDGETPIYLAARLGYNDIVKVICRACAAPTLDGPGVATALHAAITMLPEANKENSDVVEVIINAARRSFSPEEFVTFVRQKDNNMDSALHLAVRGNHLNVVMLISQAADANERNSRSKTPIYIAAEQGYKNIVEQLCQTCTFENDHGPGGQNVLHAAIIGGNKDCVLSVLAKAENLVMRGDDEGLTPLHYAAKHKFDSVLEDLIVEKEANFENQSVYEVGEKVPTPLWLATQEGHTSTVEKLMKLLPEKSCAAVNLDGRNILHLAAFQSDREMIKCILISCPAEYTKKILNKKDVNGDTPLHLLIREGCFAQELITHAEVDKMAKKQPTLHCYRHVIFGRPNHNGSVTN